MVSSHCFGVAGMVDMSCPEWSVIGAGAGAGGGGVARAGAGVSAALAAGLAGTSRDGVEGGAAGKVAAAGSTTACGVETAAGAASSKGIGSAGSAGWQAARPNAAPRGIILRIMDTVPSTRA